MMSAGSSQDKMVTLVSCDEKEFLVSQKVFAPSKTISKAIAGFEMDDKNASEEQIPLPKITAATLEKIIVYLEKHVNDPAMLAPSKGGPKKIWDWDKEYLNVDQDTLYAIMVAAEYLEIQKLIDVACQFVANMITGKTNTELVDIYNFAKNKLTEVEERSNN